MKTIGLIGGMSWESTQTYYRLLNELARARLGGLHSARVLLWSVDFAEIADLQHSGAWGACGALMSQAARGLTAGGADMIILATNTMHKVAPAIESASHLPFLHIADAVAARVKAVGCRRPALLATRFTMEDDFYVGRLKDRHGLDPLVPDEDGRAMVHRVIYDELCLGQVREESRAAYRAEIAKLKARGADGVILGCTEVGMLMSAADTDLPVFDSTILHAEAAMDQALA